MSGGGASGGAGGVKTMFLYRADGSPFDEASCAKLAAAFDRITFGSMMFEPYEYRLTNNSARMSYSSVVGSTYWGIRTKPINTGEAFMGIPKTQRFEVQPQSPTSVEVHPYILSQFKTDEDSIKSFKNLLNEAGISNVNGTPIKEYIAKPTLFGGYRRKRSGSRASRKNRKSRKSKRRSSKKRSSRKSSSRKSSSRRSRN